MPARRHVGLASRRGPAGRPRARRRRRADPDAPVDERGTERERSRIPRTPASASRSSAWLTPLGTERALDAGLSLDRSTAARGDVSFSLGARVELTTVEVVALQELLEVAQEVARGALRVRPEKIPGVNVDGRMHCNSPRGDGLRRRDGPAVRALAAVRRVRSALVGRRAGAQELPTTNGVAALAALC